MSINQSALNAIEDYVIKNHIDTYFKERALKSIKLLIDTPTIQNTKTQAVVGFDKEDKPAFWDLTKGNMIATTFTGEAMNYHGASTILLSLMLRFSKDEFQYFLLTDEPAPTFFIDNSYCAGYASVHFTADTNYEKILDSVSLELKKRKTLSNTELNEYPLILVVLGNFFAFNHNKKYNDIIASILSQGTNLRIGCLIITTRFEYDMAILNSIFNRTEHEKEDSNILTVARLNYRLVGQTDLQTANFLLAPNFPKGIIDQPHLPNVQLSYIFQDNNSQTVIKTYHNSLGICLSKAI